MNRRTLLGAVTGGVLAAPLVAWARQAPVVRRLGILGNVPFRDAEGSRLWGAFTQGLRELGYVDGQNLIIKYLSTEGQAERSAALASELVFWRPDVIVVPNNATAVAAEQATRTIPIVAATLSEGGGLVTSLARPGGNVTGLTLFSSEIAGKQLELLKDIVPHLSRVAILWNPINRPVGDPYLDQARIAAQALGIRLQVLEAQHPGEIETAVAVMRRERTSALLVFADAMFIIERRRIADLVAKARLPAMYTLREHMDAGGLAFYGPSVVDNFRRAATYVDKILKGTRPADLPVEQPTKFEFVVNLKTARALGLTIPPSLLQRADQVIE